MKFIELSVRTAMIVHGFDEENKEIIETVSEEAFVKKLIAVSRIQSVSEQFVLVTGSHGRVMYWEYEDSFEQLRFELLD